MLTTETLIAVICFGLTCFALGYTLGKDSTQKRRQNPEKVSRRLCCKISIWATDTGSTLFMFRQ